MNSGKGSFHGSWSWLSSFPSFFGFIPNSRAICTCSSDRWNLRRASIQGCKFAGMRARFFAMDASAHIACWIPVQPCTGDSENGNCGIFGQVSIASSVRLGARELDHFDPLLGFVGDELAEIGRRACEGYPTKIGEARLHLRIGEGRIDLLVDPVDDLVGGFLGRADALPATRLVTRHEITYGRNVRQHFQTGRGRNR